MHFGLGGVVILLKQLLNENTTSAIPEYQLSNKRVQSQLIYELRTTHYGTMCYGTMCYGTMCYGTMCYGTMCYGK
jgi:hypothetical protein